MVYPGASELLILADGEGGTAAARRPGVEPAGEVCDPFGLTVTVCHYPPGCSKWNPVEHRLFSQITQQLGRETAPIAGNHARLYPGDHDDDRADGEGRPRRGDLPEGAEGLLEGRGWPRI